MKRGGEGGERRGGKGRALGSLRLKRATVCLTPTLHLKMVYTSLDEYFSVQVHSASDNTDIQQHEMSSSCFFELVVIIF